MDSVHTTLRVALYVPIVALVIAAVVVATAAISTILMSLSMPVYWTLVGVSAAILVAVTGLIAWNLGVDNE